MIVVGFPFTIGLGLIFLFAGFPFFIRAVMIMIERLDDFLMAALKVLA